MDIKALAVTAIVILSLPLLGTLLAMLVGVLAALRRRPAVERIVSRFAWADRAMTRLRTAALFLGSWLEDGSARPATEPQAAPAPAVRTRSDERRHRERRRAVRRRHGRPGPERRRDERRDAQDRDTTRRDAHARRRRSAT